MPKFDVIVVSYSENPKIPPLSDNARLIPIDNLRNENLGWVRGANIGLKKSIAPYIVLMNDDVEILDRDWLEKMAEAFADPRVACVGPHGGRGFQGRQIPNSGVSIHEPKLSLDGFGIGDFPLSFFCVMFRREALEDVGYLDERFSPAYGEDDDWLARAHLKGWKMAIQTDVQVKHEGGGYAGQRGELQARNESLLRAKYKEILASAPV